MKTGELHDAYYLRVETCKSFKEGRKKCYKHQQRDYLLNFKINVGFSMKKKTWDIQASTGKLLAIDVDT